MKPQNGKSADSLKVDNANKLQTETEPVAAGNASASGVIKTNKNSTAVNRKKNVLKLEGPTNIRKRPSRLSKIFDRFANKVTKVTGSPWAFIIAFLVIIIWAVSGPIFGFSDTWQLVINTGTTIVTFLMVFVIQQSQNKDTMALQMKLNELIASNKMASNRLIDVEDLTEEELIIIKDYYIRLSSISKKEKELQRSHSIEDMETAGIEGSIEENEPKEDKRKKGPEAVALEPGKPGQSGDQKP